MRILFLLTQDLESPAGVGRYFPLAKNLARCGHEVKISALSANLKALNETSFVQDGVEVRYVGQMHVLKIGHEKLYFPTYKLILISLKATWALCKSALNVPADIIHIGKPHPMNSIAGLIAKLFKRKCLFLDYDDYEVASGHFDNIWQKKIVGYFEDHMPKWVDHITTHTTFLRQRLLNLGIPEERIFYLPNGVDVDRFETPAPEKVDKLRYDLDLIGKKVVAFIGSLSFPSHPVEILLDAFVNVLQSCPESVLLIVGGGDAFEYLKSKILKLGLSHVTRFCGRVPTSEIPVYYRLANVVVDPVEENDIGRSRLPLKLFESWISQVPFVTADVGDRKFVLGNPPAGVLTEPGNINSLAEGILIVLKNPQLALELSQYGLAQVELFSWERLAKKLETVYLEHSQVPQ